MGSSYAKTHREHSTRPIQFTLVVDDFGVKYRNKEDVEHLIETLNKIYKIKIDWTGNKYIGIAINHDRSRKTLKISMPGYVQKALKRFGIKTPPNKITTPDMYDPSWNDREKQQAVDMDYSPVVPTIEIKRIQEIVGVFSYYARCIDATMLAPIFRIASQQAAPTQRTMKMIDQLLQYAASNPEASITYYPSTMMTTAHSDASYLTERQARSRAGGFEYFPTLQGQLNGATNIISQIITLSVVTSSAEAEYAALFLNLQQLDIGRRILDDMGYKQGKVIVITDNQCARGIAQAINEPRKSKAMNMRYHWVRERVSTADYEIKWQPGNTNLADYFTKTHPAKHHRMWRSSYLSPVEGMTGTVNAAVRRARRRSLFRGCVQYRASIEGTAPGCGTIISIPLSKIPKTMATIEKPWDTPELVIES